MDQEIRTSMNLCKYFKNVGACAYGDACGFAHMLPMTSRTVLVHNMYYTPDNIGPFFMPDRSKDEKQKHFEHFYEEVFVEMSTRYGRVVEFAVSENLCDHLVGSVWVRFDSAASAERAVKSLNKRWFAGRALYAELCPVWRIEDVKCVHQLCISSPFCNYLHIQEPSPALVSRLFQEQNNRTLSDDSFTDSAEDQEEQYKRNSNYSYQYRNGGSQRTEYRNGDLTRYGPYQNPASGAELGYRRPQRSSRYDDHSFKRFFPRNANHWRGINQNGPSVDNN